MFNFGVRYCLGESLDSRVVVRESGISFVFGGILVGFGFDYVEI